jgi:hypothetical protein
MTQRLKVPFKPHPFQAEIIENLKRFNILVCHRRFGKTTLVINLLLRWALAATEKRRAWCGGYAFPIYRQAKEVAWSMLTYYSSILPKDFVQLNIAELTMTLANGSRIFLKGTTDPDSLRGPYYDAFVFDEFADIEMRAYTEVIRPLLIDRKGWAIFIGTPRGHNQFYDIVEKYKNDPDWYVKVFKHSDTNLYDQEEIEDTKKQLTPEEYAQEMECSFEAALIGSYYGPFMEDALNEGRIVSVPYEPILLTYTAWDIGTDDETAIWFFQLHPGGEIRLIDYIEESGHGVDYWCGFIKNKKYIYGQHLFPHDAQARSFAANARSTVEVARSLGLDLSVIPRASPYDGIEAARTILPRCWFDKIKTKDGIEALKSYRKKYSPKFKTFQTTPIHDWSSHGADAFRTLAVGLEFIQPTKPILGKRPPDYSKYREFGWML